MQVVCPCCATEFPLEAGTADADAKRLAALMGDMEPGLARAVIGYLRLFKPAKQALRSARALKIVGEVSALIAEGEVRRDGRTRRTTTAIWTAALVAVAERREKLRIPLESHGYLAEVVLDLADKAEAAAEQRREDQKRNPGRTGTTGGPVDALSKATQYADHMHNLGVFTKEQRDDYIRERQ